MLLAINRNLVGKPPSNVLAKYNHAFSSVDVSIDELAEMVSNGFAFCPQFGKNKRQSANFRVSGYLAVDVDHGLTVDEAQGSEFFQNYASLLYTTASHTADAHRFRVIFELEEPISDAEIMKAALTGLVAKFGGDESCKDACRMFFGAVGCQTVIHGKKLPANMVEELIIRGRESAVRGDDKSDKDAPKITVASRIHLPADIRVKTENGSTVRLDSLSSKTRVHCPNHIDSRASAFVVKSRQGNPGVHCSSCNATFFIEQPRPEPYRYDFDYDWRRIVNLSYEEYTTHADENGHVNLSEVRGGDIRLLDVQYLPFDESPVITREGRTADSQERAEKVRQFVSMAEDRFQPEYDVTFIKSPKGSGKTEWLQKLVSRHKLAENKVLLIGHRRTLINSTATRLGLTSYLKTKSAAQAKNKSNTELLIDLDEDVPAVADTDDEFIQEGYNAPTPHYAICLDSLPTRLDPRRDKYDLVIIDEVEQVFSHLLSRTLKNSRREVIFFLRHYLNTAKSIYLLDADLNRVTVEVLDAFVNDRNPRWQALVNLPIPQNRVLHLYDGVRKDSLTGELKAALDRGERCFVATNSLRWTEGLAETMEKTCERKIKSIVINSKTSKTPTIQGFIANIKQQAPLYDLIIASPSIGTGIDITFDGGEQLIDVVFGFFETRINTHFDIDQQLSRVRNPKRINVWISPETFSFETNPEVIASEIRSMEAEFKKMTDISSDGVITYSDEEDKAGKIYEKVYAAVSASRRASINNLRQNFIELRKSNGWEVVDVVQEEELTKVGRAIRNTKNAADEDKRQSQIIGADRLCLDEYRQLKKKPEEKWSEAERSEIDRFEIESFYCRDVTPALLKEDANWKLRRAIRYFQLLMAPDDVLKDQDREFTTDLFLDKRKRLQIKRLLVDLLSVSGIFTENEFLADVEISTPTLQAFAKRCIYQKAKIEELLNVSVRSDVFKKPKQQLQSIVELLGLKFKNPRTEQTENAKKYFYLLDEKALKLVKTWAEELSNPELKERWRASRDVDVIARGIDAIQRRKENLEEIAS